MCVCGCVCVKMQMLHELRTFQSHLLAKTIVITQMGSTHTMCENPLVPPSAITLSTRATKLQSKG